MQAEFSRGGQLQHVLLLYTQALLTRISQGAICNCLHSVEKRLCRWLLLCHDRVEGSEILMTQEYIANMLGGRRESVTVAAGHLQEAGLIHYSRGRITVVDRSGLEELVCECYQTVEDEIERLFGPSRRTAAIRGDWGQIQKSGTQPLGVSPFSSDGRVNRKKVSCHAI
jgi:hypothetical protein